ncbi:MAG TPA: DNA repair protein RecN [Saprospiraceae bacterium]|nr:DNA repair protein RecN [Saprospiraceae bacterium]
MLKRLHIRNYALIDELEIHFSDQLTIITGETGAGKSILLGALGLIMGDRADTKVFYNDAEKCVVEAFFDVSEYDLKAFFEENELDYDQEVVIRRELSPAGKSRAFVNDTPANNQVLQRLTENLVDLHQQFDTLDIHNVNFQLRMIDALADNNLLLKEYQQGYRKYAADKKRLAELIERSQNGAREMEFLRFQLEELQQAELQDGEQEQLEGELAQLTNAEDIKRNYGAAYNHLADSELNLVGQLQELNRSLAPTRKLSPQLAGVSERLDAILLDLQDVAKDCERIAESTEYDPQRIGEVQERLNVLYKLQKKHGAGSVSELLDIQNNLEAQTAGFTNLDQEIVALEQAIAAQEKSLRTQAATLSQRRKSVPASFEERVQAMLTQLSMPHAQLKVDISELQQLGPTGLDEVQFLFATNIGARFLPIKDVASGGELSRLTLCTKSLVADAIPLPTLIFDEIDTGISGDVSLKMGMILKELSSRHQVISITHTPQIAARADAHYFVYKKIDGQRTVTNIRKLETDERIRSIAVMLSGNPPSDSALATARELVGER